MHLEFSVTAITGFPLKSSIAEIFFFIISKSCESDAKIVKSGFEPNKTAMLIKPPPLPVPTSKVSANIPV